MKLWAMPCRATQDGWVIVESSDKMWSTGEGNGKPLLYTYRESVINCIKKAGMLQSMGSQRVRHNWATEKQIGTNGLPWWLSSEECACQHKRHGLNPWVGKISERRKWQPTPVFLREIPWAEEPGGLQSMGSQRVRHNLATKQQTGTKTERFLLFPLLGFSM